MKNYLFLLLSFLSINTYGNNNHNKHLSSVNGFIENKGQIVDMKGNPVPNVLFKIQTNNLDCYITESGITYLFKKYSGEGDKANCDWERVDLTLKKATIKKENILKEHESKQGKLDFYLEHCPRGIKGVKEYGKITIKNIYPNIDWILYNTSNKGFKYDFVLNKGASPDNIELIYGGKEKVKLLKHGELEISTRFGRLVEKAPVSFLNNEKVGSQFFIKKTESNKHNGINTTISFKFEELVPKIIQDQKLVIDPILEWSTFYAGYYSERLNAIETDSEGNIIFAGFTLSLDFPVLDGGGYYSPSTTTLQSTFNQNWDCFIVKLDNQGNRLWATCIGAVSRDMIRDLAIDNMNNIFLVGETQSTTFPTVYQSGAYNKSLMNNYDIDGIILKFSPSGNLIWSTMFGGSDYDRAMSVAVNPINNHFVVVGTTESNSDFPTFDVPNAITQTNGQCFISEFDNDGVLVWSTKFASGQPSSITFDQNGNLFIVGSSRIVNGTNYNEPLTLQDNGTYFQSSPNTISSGSDMFFSKINTNRQLEWSTYFGGGGQDIARTVKVDGEGNVYIDGNTSSNDIPTLDAGGLFFSSGIGWHAFLLKFSNSGELLWASHYPEILQNYNGEYNNYRWRKPNSIVIDKCNHDVFFKLESFEIGANNPLVSITQNSFQSQYKGGISDAVILKINKNTDLLYATYLGGDGRDSGGGISLDPNGNLVVGVNNQYINNESSYPLLQGSGYYQDQINDIYPQGNNKIGTFIIKFTKETLNNGVVPQVENQINFCDSISYNNNWYQDSQELTQVLQNQYGCDSIIEITKLINDCELTELEFNLLIPNIFTPNGDKENDLFKITSNGELIEKDGELSIFNRWGNKIFNSNKEMEWNGGKQSEGVYFYLFIYKGKNYKGSFSLFK